ncbi:MAG: DNA mismatch repair protein MutS, partial [Eubacteriaceae bacterium]|nr:DNA mismatch repair protein MutS [Eubacteriaceae bacterium]
GRDCGLEERAPMCGVPFHAVDSYVARLVDKGFKVAICEQMEDPRFAKGLVERQITRIITSGTVTDMGSLADDKNNYIMSVYYNKVTAAVVYCDITTGEITLNVITGDDVEERFYNVLSSVKPSEILVNPVLYQSNDVKGRGEALAERPFTPMASSYYSADKCERLILEQFRVYSLDALGLSVNDESVKALGVLVAYLRETQRNELSHIDRLRIASDTSSMHIDPATRRNLELTETMRNSAKKGSLLWVLDKTVTAVGGRTLRKWISEPLVELSAIQERLDAVEVLYSDPVLLEDVMYYLRQTSDIQRLCSRLSYRTVNGKDLISLKNTLERMPMIKDILTSAPVKLIREILDDIDPLDDIRDLISRAINEDCTVNIKDGNTFKEGYSEKADEIRSFRTNSREILAKLEADEKEKSGIKNLKIKYNKVFGYYFEVSKGQLDLVPDHFIRKQTLVNAERFYTEELKDIETRLMSAQEELEEIETALFDEIVDHILKYVGSLQKTAEAVGRLDCLCSFAYVSANGRYVRPETNTEGIIDVRDSRHPVVELLSETNRFIPNDIYLDCGMSRMNIITGPNMAGKSTYIRQTALISIMFQIGCFVPASKANMCVVDRVFTRVGASDDLSRGQSTFMVEMSEVSNILKHATGASLVILDEVGRGTSTLDGLSIARAVAEHLCDKDKCGAKTLFATHYHELTQLADTMEGVVNLHIDIAETDSGVVFLHRIKPGAASRSYGIEVARLAGLPEDVIERSEQILSELEAGEGTAKKSASRKTASSKKAPSAGDMSLFNYVQNNVTEQIRNLPLESMTPMEVFSFIAKLKEEIK